MAKGLFFGALSAVMLFSTVALAERGSDDKEVGRGANLQEKSVKDRVVDAAKRHHDKNVVTEKMDKAPKAQRPDKIAPRGEVFGDQATREKAGTHAAISSSSSGVGSVNTPAEIAAMMKMINPMYGAYRTSAADSGTDSYGGRTMTPQGYHTGNAQNGGAAMLTQYVHFKDEKGNVIATTHGNTATAMKNRLIKSMIMGKVLRGKQGSISAAAKAADVKTEVGAKLDKAKQNKTKK